jgi:hypothetical protein
VLAPPPPSATAVINQIDDKQVPTGELLLAQFNPCPNGKCVR